MHELAAIILSIVGGLAPQLAVQGGAVRSVGTVEVSASAAPPAPAYSVGATADEACGDGFPLKSLRETYSTGWVDCAYSHKRATTAQ